MKLKDFALMFGIFLITFYAASSFIYSFRMSIEAPSEITQAWNASFAQINQTMQAMSTSMQAINSGGLNAIVGSFGLALSGIYFIIISTANVMLSVPIQVFSAVNYLASTFSIPTQIVYVLVGIISILIIFEIIKFITGRET